MFRMGTEKHQFLMKSSVSSIVDALYSRLTQADGTAKLLQAFFALRMDLRRQPPDLLAIRSSASCLCRVVSATVRGVGSITEPEKYRTDGPTGIWSAIRKIYQTLLEALELLHAHPSSSSSAKALVSELTRIFFELLKCLQSFSVQEQVSKPMKDCWAMLTRLLVQKYRFSEEVRFSGYQRRDSKPCKSYCSHDDRPRPCQGSS